MSLHAIFTHKQAVFFDLDGTLVDTVADVHQAVNRTLQQNQLTGVTEAQVRQWVGRGAANLIACVMQYLQVKLDEQLFLQQFLVNYTAKVFGLSQIYPQVVDLLTACQQAGLKLACITNKPLEPAQLLLQQLQLTPYFDLILGGDSLAEKKPHPLPLNHALTYFSLTPGDAVMVGDSKNDVLAAKAAHITSVAWTNGYNHGENIADCQPDLLVNCWSELLL